MNKLKSALTFFVSLLFISCQSTNENKNLKDALASNIDSSANPGDDFFKYANGRWFKENPIPASESYNGIFRTISDTVNAQIKQVCLRAASTVNEPGSLKQKIGDMYFSGMDSVSIEREGLNALKEQFEKIERVNDIPSLMKAASRIHMISSKPLFDFYIGQDQKISSKNAIYISQGGLGLPDRDYYFDKDERAVSIRNKYRIYLINVFKLMGSAEKAATQSSKSVFELETHLAKASRKIEGLRDPFNNYNKMSFSKLSKAYPSIDFSAFMAFANVNPDSVIVGQPEFLAALNREIKTTPLTVWKDYLRFNLLRGLSPNLDSKTYMEYWNFYSKTFGGATVPRTRWKRVVNQTNDALGDLVGQIYVEEYLPKGTKEKLNEIGNAIKDVFSERIKRLDWMSEATKQKAGNKLATMIFKVGYPDKWKDLSSLKIERTSYVQNVMRANEWEWNFMISKYGKPVDRTEWDMQPQDYNAYYNPSNNEIVVPACNIIVPGYERKLADDAILYSIIGGSTFGHEITHGFDDQGSKYDQNGNLKNWWMVDDSVKFYSKTKAIVRQFKAYKVVDSLYINGEATQGENIADLGGVMMALEAFKKTTQFKEGKSIAGLTPAQRFFLGYAQAWMVNLRPEALATTVKTDVHSPPQFRVIGPLSDMSEFYEAFGVKPGDYMYRSDTARVSIW
jgi:putative endopeptidase